MRLFNDVIHTRPVEAQTGEYRGGRFEYLVPALFTYVRSRGHGVYLQTVYIRLTGRSIIIIDHKVSIVNTSVTSLGKIRPRCSGQGRVNLLGQPPGASVRVEERAAECPMVRHVLPPLVTHLVDFCYGFCHRGRG